MITYRIYCPSNGSKQIQETHMYTTNCAGTQYTRQCLNEKQHTWLHRQTVTFCEVMHVVFHSNSARYIVCRGYKLCEFLEFVWIDCMGNKSYYVITSLAYWSAALEMALELLLNTLKFSFLCTRKIQKTK